MHPIWKHRNASAIVIPTHAASMTTGIFKEAMEEFPGIQVIYERESRYHRLKPGKPLYVTRGVIRDMTPFNAVHAVQGKKSHPPDIVLFPIRSAASTPEILMDIRTGMEEMANEWWSWAALGGGGKIAFPSLMESTYFPDSRLEKQLFDSILGDDPRFVWIGDGYGQSL